MQHGREKSAGELLARDSQHQAFLNRRLEDEKILSGLNEKRDANRRGIRIDGLCIVCILGIGLAATSGVGPSPHVSATVAFLFFIGTVVLFQQHARSVLDLSH